MTDKRCRICGSAPTIRAHLFPRALQHDIRGDSKHVVAIMPAWERQKFLQSGEWSDRILCEEHEKVALPWDDYAIDFCRTLEEKAGRFGETSSVLVPNPRASDLIMFAHVVTWRHAAVHTSIERQLGPYFGRIQAAIFDSAPPLELVVVEPGHISGGRRAQLGMCPTKGQIHGVNVFRFDIGGLAFILKTDQRPFSWPLREFTAMRDPLLVLLQDPVEVSENPIFRDWVKAKG